MVALVLASPPILRLITILEDVLLGRMAMEVQIHKELLLVSFHQLLA
jgi:hypothetical protein